MRYWRCCQTRSSYSPGSTARCAISPRIGASFAALVLVIGLTWSRGENPKRRIAFFLCAFERCRGGNQAKTNFIAVSHMNTQNPLNSILLWCNGTDHCRERRRQNRSRRQFANRSAATPGSRLIEDLLEVSRIESGQCDLTAAHIISPEVVRAGGLKSMSPAADASRLRWQVVLDQRADVVMGDSQRLQQPVESPVQRAQVHAKGGKVAGRPRGA